MASEDQSNNYIKTTEMWGEEVKRMRKICLPMAATNLVSYLKGMVSVSCMGRLGPLELAGGSLAVGVTNITGISVLNGLSLGLDPICSQAVGSRNHSLATSALRRTVILLLVASSPSLHSGAPSVLPSLPLLGPFRRLRCPNLRHLICSISPLTFPPPPPPFLPPLPLPPVTHRRRLRPLVARTTPTTRPSPLPLPRYLRYRALFLPFRLCYLTPPLCILRLLPPT
ncbi:hypothetical protein HPP92_017228 [Vanilla planifolia]|uniref:Uncharacterized protein n=1 Tax=Vanilla planifolia TaxID=51239 RepID=A0A835UQT9_VANPL|nr:hypothetical protein HPP92_017228 [Vanilla planifolia]